MLYFSQWHSYKPHKRNIMIFYEYHLSPLHAASPLPTAVPGRRARYTRRSNLSTSRNTTKLVATNYIYIIITMTQQPYMGSGLLFSEVTGSCAFVAVGDWSTGRAAVLSILWPPEPSGRQSGDLGEKWPQFCLRNISKSTTWDRRLYFPSEGSGAPDCYHP
jgi:hypothetical protein